MRSPCFDDNNLKKGPWTPEEDQKLIDYIKRNGHMNWKSIPKQAGLNRCGKSCRLRWTNYLRPDIKRGHFTANEEQKIIKLHSVLGNKWSRIASHLPGRTDNEIKNFWNTQIRKKLLQMGIDPHTHKPRTDFNHLLNLSQLLSATQFANPMSTPWENNNVQVAQIQLLQNLLQIMNPSTTLLTSGPHLNANILNLIASSSGTPHEGLLNNPLSAVPNESQVDVGGNFEAGFGLNDLETNNKTLGSASSFDVPAENTIPPLVEASPVQNNSISSTPTSLLSAAASPADNNDFFEDWEKLLSGDGDGTTDPYWTEILDLASSSQSPLFC